MKKFISISVFFFFGLTWITQAQIYSSPNSNPQLIQMIHRSLVVEKEAYLHVHGNPFVDKDFEKGEIIFNDSSRVKDVPLRLNTYTDNIEFNYNDTIKVISTPDIIDYITFGNRKFIYSRYKEGVFYKNGFFEIFADGNTRLLLHRETIIKREQLPPSDYEGGNFRDYFLTTKTFYIKKGIKPAVKISKSKKSILNVLGDHRKELVKYIKDNHLRMSKADALIDLVYYYNSLSFK